MVHAILLVGVVSTLVLVQLVIVFVVYAIWSSISKDRHS
jgi:hypothetical protein